MCQLTLIDTKDILAKQILLYIQMEENSRLQNKDGCGFYTPTVPIFKSKHACSLLLNFGLFTKNLTQRPVIGHVRNASQIAITDKKIDEEHAHPFETKNFILAHNGTLQFTEENTELNKLYKDTNLIDSQIFLEELEKKNGFETSVALVDTMKMFRGKFALLIYSKKEDKFYVAKGKTAPLFRFDFNINGEKGFIINTEKDSLERAVLRSLNLFMILDKEVICSAQDKCEELKAETVFRVDEETHSLVELCSIEEKPRETSRITYYEGSYVTTPSYAQDKAVNEIVSFLKKFHLTVKDLDSISYTYYGTPLSYYTQTDLDNVGRLIKELDKRYDKATTKVWCELTKKVTPSYLYKKYSEIKFPYFFTERTVLNQILLKEDKKE